MTCNFSLLVAHRRSSQGSLFEYDLVFNLFLSLSINLAWRARQATISSMHSLPRQQEATLFIPRGSSLRLRATISRRQAVIFYHTLFHHTPPDCLFKDHHDMSLVSHTPRDIHVPILTADQIMAGANPTTRPISVVLLQPLSTAQPG